MMDGEGKCWYGEEELETGFGGWVDWIDGIWDVYGVSGFL